MTKLVELVAWNMAHRLQSWDHLGSQDVALLTEAVAPPVGFETFTRVHGEWTTAGEKRRSWSAAVAWQADAPVEVLDHEPSRAGTLSAVVYDSKVILAACYATWEPDPNHPEWKSGRSDWSALALADDLASLQQENSLPVIAAGDWNLWPSNYPNSGGCSIITPVEAKLRGHAVHRISLEGERIREELRSSTYGRLPESAVPTYDHQRKGTPRYEIDHVFASDSLAVFAEALNSVEDWGPSDHCKIRVRLSNRN